MGVYSHQVTTMIRRAESIACQVVFGSPETLLAKSKSRDLRRSQKSRAVRGGTHSRLLAGASPRPHSPGRNHVASSAWWTPRPPCSARWALPSPGNRRRVAATATRPCAANCFSKPPAEEKILQRRGGHIDHPFVLPLGNTFASLPC